MFKLFLLLAVTSLVAGAYLAESKPARNLKAPQWPAKKPPKAPKPPSPPTDEDSEEPEENSGEDDKSPDPEELKKKIKKDIKDLEALVKKFIDWIKNLKPFENISDWTSKIGASADKLPKPPKGNSKG